MIRTRNPTIGSVMASKAMLRIKALKLQAA
jgi:hypothetical protein